MTSGDDDNSDFRYQGHLVFNGLYYSERIEGSEFPRGLQAAEAALNEEFPDYKPGTVEKPGEGYEKLLLRDYIRDDESIDEELQQIANSLIAFRYMYQDFYEAEAYEDGDWETVQIPNLKDTDIYWMYPDHMFLRGAKQDVKDTINRTREALSGNIAIRSIDFEGDFLLWLYYKYRDGQSPLGGIQIDRLTDSEAVGKEDFFGKSNVVHESRNLAQSTPLLVGILRGKSLSMLEGDFSVLENSIRARINSNRVRVLASKGAIRQSRSNARRIALSLQFINELVELKDHWDSLAPDQKYPPREFFENVYQECRNQGLTIDAIPESLLKKYASLRGEDIDDWL